ncbi:hypothetical protein M422DRAFT_259600 [Sphaerobolus stellatus SS14]|uniref:CCHC-type domain-containing protein n=1 Tax=Sphaerobolus stellatus (strain SS14) TaxID=990650 RepID=A0A0C9U487_SPHS4|nr:hypothetical protein M422DRAFT_259600 [Sphaerobolus stellatus SS14]
MADYPNKDDQPVYLLYWVEFVEELKANFRTASPEEDVETALEELEMEKHHQATWLFISFAKYKAKTAYNDRGYYCLVMNAMPDWILEELHRVFPMPKSYETLHSMILQIDQCYWNHKKIMDLRWKGAPKPPTASNTALSGNNNNNNNNQSGNNKSKENKLNSNKGKTNTSMSAGASSSKTYDNSHRGTDGQLTQAEKKHQKDNGLCLVCGIKGHVAQDCRKARWNQNTSSSSTSHPAPMARASITEEKPKTDDKAKAKESPGIEFRSAIPVESLSATINARTAKAVPVRPLDQQSKHSAHNEIPHSTPTAFAVPPPKPSVSFINAVTYMSATKAEGSQCFTINLDDPTFSTRATKVDVDTDILNGVPKEYHEYADIFSKSRADTLH